MVALCFAGVAACGGDAPAITASPKPKAPSAGDVLTDAAGWVEWTVGDAPLIISAPHGGLLAPSELPTRDCAVCATDNDLNTQELARLVAAQFKDRTGRRPHLVINLLRRSKLDANREAVEATDDNPALTATWAAYHGFIDSSRTRITAAHGRGLLLDLHGHGHAIPRLELGYLISPSDLRLSDAALTSKRAIGSSSIARIAVTNAGGITPTALLRGPASMGALFVRNGYPAVPSPADPAPGEGEEYFTGGYTTVRHGSSSGGTVDAVQVEANRTGVRDTQTNVERYAAAIVTVAIEYLGTHYGWVPPTVAMSPPWLPGAGRMAATLRARATVPRSVQRAAPQASPRSASRPLP